MKLPESLLVAMSCAALAGCQTSFAGGRAATPEPVVAPTVEVVEVVQTGPTIPEVDGRVQRPRKHVRPAVSSIIPEVSEPVIPLQPAQPKIEVTEEWPGWDCPACGMG